MMGSCTHDLGSGGFWLVEELGISLWHLLWLFLGGGA